MPGSERATAGLRARLRQAVLEGEGAAVLPDWATLQVTGPTADWNRRGTV